MNCYINYATMRVDYVERVITFLSQRLAALYDYDELKDEAYAEEARLVCAATGPLIEAAELLRSLSLRKQAGRPAIAKERAMKPPIKYPNLVKDALYHTQARSGASEEKAQGVVLGVVCMLMALGMQFFEALHYMEGHLPKEYRLHAIPEPWREGLARKEGR